MTLEEKIAHLQASSMEEARAEGNAIIDAYRESLEKMLVEYKKEAIEQSNVRIETETVNARQQLNQAMAKLQLDLKHNKGKTQQELKDKLFSEVIKLVHDFMKTTEYLDFLVKCIRNATSFAGGEQMIIYINPSDESHRAYLEETCGTQLTVSAEDFIGGMRAVIRSRNILIDNSFKTQLHNEYDKFLFLGGGGVA